VQIQTCNATNEKPFEKSEQIFQTLTTALQGKAVLGMTHSALERYMAEQGRGLMRQLIQDHLDFRGIGGAMGPVIGRGGVSRTFPRTRERALSTIFGAVTVTRLGYSAHDEESLFPRDAELNLPPGLYSHQLQRTAVDEIIKGSFDQAAESVLSSTGTRIPKRQIEGIAAQAAMDFDAFYEESAGTSAVEGKPTGPILVMSTDGKGIVMREGSLREKTRKAAATSTHKMAKRLSRGEKDNRKRMAQVAAVYTIAPFERTAEDVVKDYRAAQSDSCFALFKLLFVPGSGERSRDVSDGDTWWACPEGADAHVSYRDYWPDQKRRDGQACAGRNGAHPRTKRLAYEGTRA